MSKDAEQKLYTEDEVKALMAPLLAKIEALELRIAKMRRDSSTSSKPPSSDLTKPPKGGTGGGGSNQKLKRGGQMQFCWSHLIRDLKFLLTLPALISQKYGLRVLRVVRRMFALWHRRFDLGEAYYRRALQRARVDLLESARSKSNHPEVRKLSQRLTSRYADSYFTFMNYRDVDPTNNRTEQQIRFVVIGRKVTQGTKAPIGKQWCERIWTTLATCRKRGIQLYHFLVKSIQAKLGNRQCYPSLIY